MKKCPKCGSDCPDGAKFCPEDGFRFPAAPAPEAAPSAPARSERLTPVPAAKEADSYKPADPDTEEWGEPEANPEPSKFSETAWFMAAVKPENLAEKANQEELDGKYERNESLSEEERQKYSLNRHDPGKGGN